MKIPFWKMHGAGNDFILLTRFDPAVPPTPSKQHIQTWCQHHTGIGSDGLIIIQPSDSPDIPFRMLFYNPDGREAAMCGNGARCAARFAFEQGIAPSEMKFETGSGIVSATVNEDSVTLDMQIPRVIKLDQLLEFDNERIHFDFADTGVPHAVVLWQDLATLDLQKWGRSIRQHPHFAPEGTNVDFIEILSDRSLRIRTYERGVEAETLACGTGVAAAAVTAILKKHVSSPVQVHTAGNDTLVMTVTHHAQEIHHLQMTGPATNVFYGYLMDNA